MMIFWLAIFAVLPFGNRPDEDVSEGNVHSAPSNPRLKQKFIATAILSAILWGIVFTLIQMDVIDFYDIAQQMVKEDMTK